MKLMGATPTFTKYKTWRAFHQSTRLTFALPTPKSKAAVPSAK